MTLEELRGRDVRRDHEVLDDVLGAVLFVELEPVQLIVVEDRLNEFIDIVPLGDDLTMLAVRRM